MISGTSDAGIHQGNLLHMLWIVMKTFGNWFRYGMQSCTRNSCVISCIIAIFVLSCKETLVNLLLRNVTFNPRCTYWSSTQIEKFFHLFPQIDALTIMWQRSGSPKASKRNLPTTLRLLSAKRGPEAANNFRAAATSLAATRTPSFPLAKTNPNCDSNARAAEYVFLASHKTTISCARAAFSSCARHIFWIKNGPKIPEACRKSFSCLAGARNFARRVPSSNLRHAKKGQVSAVRLVCKLQILSGISFREAAIYADQLSSSKTCLDMNTEKSQNASLSQPLSPLGSAKRTGLAPSWTMVTFLRKYFPRRESFKKTNFTDRAESLIPAEIKSLLRSPCNKTAKGAALRTAENPVLWQTVLSWPLVLWHFWVPWPSFLAMIMPWTVTMWVLGWPCSWHYFCPWSSMVNHHFCGGMSSAMFQPLAIPGISEARHDRLPCGSTSWEGWGLRVEGYKLRASGWGLRAEGSRLYT